MWVSLGSDLNYDGSLSGLMLSYAQLRISQSLSGCWWLAFCDWLYVFFLLFMAHEWPGCFPGQWSSWVRIRPVDFLSESDVDELHLTETQTWTKFWVTRPEPKAWSRGQKIKVLHCDSSTHELSHWVVLPPGWRTVLISKSGWSEQSTMEDFYF